MGFKLKLIFSYIFIIAISFGLLTFFLSNNLEQNSLQDIKTALIRQAVLIENQIAPASLPKADLPYLEALARALSPKAACRITIINNQGKVLADSEKAPQDILNMENHLNRPEVRSALAGRIGIDTHRSATLKIDMLYVAVPIIDQTRTEGVLRLALPLTSVQKTLRTVRNTIFQGLLFALGLALILGSILAIQIIKPVNRMIQVSRKFAEGDFSRRVIQASRDEIGELAATLNKMAQDIEDKIKETGAQNQKLAAIFNSMIEGVIVADEAGRIISINPTISKIFGVTEQAAKGRFFLEAIRNNDLAEVINRVFENGKLVSDEISLSLPVRGIFQVNAVPVFTDGKVGGCLVVIHDITEMRRLETVRSDFVANVSHELKTPLTSIKGFVETLLDGALDDKANNRDFLKIIQDHVERLDGLVNDLLSLAHLESKEITLEKKAVDLRQLAEEVILGFSSQLKKKDIKVTADLPVGITVHADKARLGQVFTNLIDNAIKFNKERGSIRVSGQKAGDSMKIVVEDSGLGIPQKDVLRIFERFYRVDKARSRELGGTGLGLSIVKHIVELHGGSVGVESTEGLGSKFWFTIPQ